MTLTLSQIQRQVGGEISGSGETAVCGVNSLELAQPGDISFAENERYLDKARLSGASALVVPKSFPDLDNADCLKVDRPRETFIGIMMLFDKNRFQLSGIHPSAVISPNNVELGESVAVGECAVIRDNVKIGGGTQIESGVHIASNVTIGENCRIGPNVSILSDVTIGSHVVIHAGTVIGGEGFGYFWNGTRQQKVPQLGGVRIDDHVEIGCNTCIDRATFGMTRIRQGVKIDNLVQIAHNNDIGDHSIIVSHVGLSGSVTLGKRVTLAGQVGVADHITIGDGATAAARTGISKDIPPGQVDWGAPNRPIKQVMKEFACIARLPKLMEQVKEMAKRLSELEKKLG
ncbi:MAG: UDP-3-O-(3-hydroxymyristoyl)glucosamine N-acyltransferase [Gammaproteobacteria bacterium]